MPGTGPDARATLARFRQAKDARREWEDIWLDAYDHALPQRGSFVTATGPGRRRSDRLFDGTAPDAVDQLAAALLAQLTPPWSRWFGLDPGPEVPADEREMISGELALIAETLQSHFDRSNFVVEVHQAYLDLVTGGTASLLLEEAAAGEPSAFRFTAVPLTELYIDEGPGGRLDSTFRRFELTLEAFRARYPRAKLPAGFTNRAEDAARVSIPVIEAVEPRGMRYGYVALLERSDDENGPQVLATGEFDQSPFINFRWMKAPGEKYGRSPVIKALPDIRTANKVVELILKNASIAVTGIWQADDDGVLNPANIQLTPGTIIPKAVGSQGLTPLASPGDFDVSQLVLEDLRARIRHALLADRLGQIRDPGMTATEVLERSAEVSRVLGATFGRLQVELLQPLIDRGLAILRRRKEIPDVTIDGRMIELVYRSPLALEQGRLDAANVQTWLQVIAGLGLEALAAVDLPRAARWFGRVLGVPPELVRPQPAADAGQTMDPTAISPGAPQDAAPVDEATLAGLLQDIASGNGQDPLAGVQAPDAPADPLRAGPANDPAGQAL